MLDNFINSNKDSLKFINDDRNSLKSVGSDGDTLKVSFGVLFRVRSLGAKLFLKLFKFYFLLILILGSF